MAAQKRINSSWNFSEAQIIDFMKDQLSEEEFMKFMEEMQDRMQNGTPEQKLEVCEILYNAFHGSILPGKPEIKHDQVN